LKVLASRPALLESEKRDRMELNIVKLRA
jgi:hypothetical protein